MIIIFLLSYLKCSLDEGLEWLSIIESIMKTNIIINHNVGTDYEKWT